ncbi:MAG: hypothetical protein H6832_02115 [Planctomycetes bacterium]|nr:hypothetical protein [Planctomycetota bacterium]MCB9917184.1 hypothetical protein [Planctomycetota bacterium]
MRSTIVLLSLAAASTAQAPAVGEFFPTQQYPVMAREAPVTHAARLSSLAAFRGKKVLLVQFASW